MGKTLEFRLPDKAASGEVGYETSVYRKKAPPNVELGIWDEELKERFRVLERITAYDGELFVYFLKKFN
jgi:hypothetical protein